MIAALYVESEGCYSGQPNIDLWSIDRDARQYQDDHPIIAHPPCHRWGKMAKVNEARWGGEHNKLGADGGCFKSAVFDVNRCGGVLEHPAQSYAWEAHGLATPIKGKWTPSGMGWVCEVWQSAYGHKANKATWLYYRGFKKPFDLNWSRPKGTHQVGFQDQRGKSKNKPTLSKKEANATPEAFRDLLIQLAEYSRA